MPNVNNDDLGSWLGKLQKNEVLSGFFENMIEGVAYHKVIFDSENNVVDYVFLEVNTAFERLTGLKREKVLGKKITQVLPGIEKDPAGWINIYGKVASTCEPVKFENFALPLDKWFSVSAFCPEKGYFVATFEDITERKKAEVALQEKEQRWATTLSSIGDAVIATDLTGQVTFMNGLAERLTGWSFSDAKQKPLALVFKIINEHSRRTVESPVSRILTQGEVVGLANHTLLLRKNGAEVPIDDSGAPIKDKDGKITGVVLVFRDISERRKSDLEITRLASFPKLNPNPVIEVDFEGVVQYANPATEIMFPDLKKEGSTHSFLYDWKHIVKTFRNGKKRSLNRQAKIGAHWYYQNFNLVPNKKQIRVYSVNIDELKQVEEELRRSAEVTRQRVEELETLMDMIPAPIFVSRDPECRVITGNKAANEFYEANPTENVSAGASSGGEQDFTRRFFQNGRELKPEELPMQEAVIKNKTIKNSEFEVLTPSGKKKSLLGNASPLKDNEGSVRGCIATFVDITDRKQMQQKLEQYTAHLEELVKERTQQLKIADRLSAIGETAGMVGHDLRNPLQTVTNETYLAKDELKMLPDSPAKANLEESIQIIGDQISYMDKIVSDLQNFVRPITPEKQLVNLPKLLDDTLTEINIPENIEVNTEISKNLPNIPVDSQLLKRVFINLMTNAVQAMPNGGKLTIKTQKKKDKEGNPALLIQIKDTGVGIAENIKPKLFTPLFTTKSRGQGFGLSVCKRVIEAHNGVISYESQEGKGAQFNIELPLNE